MGAASPAPQGTTPGEAVPVPSTADAEAPSPPVVTKPTPTGTSRISTTPPRRSTAPSTRRPAQLRVGAFLSVGLLSMGLLLFMLVRAGRKQPVAHADPATAFEPKGSADPAASSEATPMVADPGASNPPALVQGPDAGAALPPPPPLWRVAMLAKDATYTYADGAVGHHTLTTVLTAAGLAKGEVHRVVRAFSDLKNLDHCNPKDTYAFAKDRQSGKVVAFEYATSPVDVWQARDKDGELEANKLELRVDEKRVAVAVAVADDLRSSIVQAGLDDDLLKMLDDALDGHAELADLKAGVRLRIVATEERVDGQFSRYPSLDAVEYTPAGASATALRVYYFARGPSHERGKSGGFFDAKGQAPYQGGWRSPVPLARIASRFNPHRMHPLLHVVMPHNGVDFAAPPGTPVYAAAAGTLKSAGDGGPCGNMVQIDHPRGLTSAYCHLQRFASGLHQGQRVEARQLIGYVGQTGRATGPHLHFAIRHGEIFVDPLAFRLDGVRVIPPLLRDDFSKTKADMDAALDGVALPPAAPSREGDKDDKEDTVFDDSPGLE
jgi:murein DD-endopeptidase MepM/ murein hydrolase activator NlpD